MEFYLVFPSLYSAQKKPSSIRISEIDRILKLLGWKSAMMKMRMTLHWSKELTLLLDSWKTESWPSYLLNFTLLFSLIPLSSTPRSSTLKAQIHQNLSPSSAAAAATVGINRDFDRCSVDLFSETGTGSVQQDVIRGALRIYLRYRVRDYAHRHDL